MSLQAKVAKFSNFQHPLSHFDTFQAIVLLEYSIVSCEKNTLSVKLEGDVGCDGKADSPPPL